MKRTLLFADVHANLPALQAVLAKAGELGVDSHLFLGDAVGYGPHPKEVIEVLAGLPSAVFVLGNHDHAVATSDTEGMSSLAAACIRWTASVLSKEELAWLSALPAEHVEGEWMAIHGAPADPYKFNVYISETNCRESLSLLEKAQKTTCFFGHTHAPGFHRRVGGKDETIRRPNVVDIVPGRQHLINPGSVGQPRDGNSKASFAVWDRATREVSYHRVPYAMDVTIAALQKAGLHTDLGYRLELGR
jgi:predicted phosphodiesterase